MIVVHCNCYRTPNVHLDSCPMSWPEPLRNDKPFPPDPKAPPSVKQCVEGMPYFDSIEEAQATDRTAKLQRRIDILETSVIEERRLATNAMSSAVAKGIALIASNKSLELARAENEAFKAAIRAHEERNAALLRCRDRLEERNERHARNYELLKAESQALRETLESRGKDLARAEEAKRAAESDLKWALQVRADQDASLVRAAENIASLRTECARLNESEAGLRKRCAAVWEALTQFKDGLAANK